MRKGITIVAEFGLYSGVLTYININKDKEIKE